MKVNEIYAIENVNDCCIHLVRDRLFWQAWENTAKVAKEFKYGLADNIREDVLLLVESLHLNVNGLECLDSKEIGLSLNRLGIKFRLLCDLRQISMKQWVFINKQLDDLLNFFGQSLSIQGLGERAVLVQ